MERNRSYDDIIGLPRPVSFRHPKMALSERAVQFAPFAALIGHGDVLREAAMQNELLMESDGSGVLPFLDPDITGMLEKEFGKGKKMK